MKNVRGRFYWTMMAGLLLTGYRAGVAHADFIKHGNNGTVNCNTFCAGAQWGPVGPAKSAALLNLPCNQTPGFLNAELSCFCSSYDGGARVFYKPFDNGAVSCDTYCAGPQWGPVGYCHNAYATYVPTDVVPGFIANGSELTCTCGDSKVEGDLNNDGIVDCKDYAPIKAAVFGIVNCDSNTDVNHDGLCNVMDMQLQLSRIPGGMVNGVSQCQ